MKRSFMFSTLLPTALALGVSVGCAHGNTKATEPRPAAGINAEDIARAPAVSIEQLLISRVPGLVLTRGRDGHTVMHLRGVGTSDEEEPLFVVNGIALGSASSLGAINRFDIASIEVLKDPASTAMYGMRGANGVIVIKTKGS